jgi:NADPH:quinone reductase-like Zn-dependent oxidoreductase
VVEAVGSGVTQVKPGDEVFGWGDGAFAEYLAAPAMNVLPKPPDFTFEQAAATGVSAFTALKAMRDRGQVQPGQKVLVNGASGGVGPFAVQVAKSMGAEVTGVCGTRNVDMVRSIGADHVIDYSQEDFTTGDARYDFILDNVGNRSLSEIRRVLTPQGKVQPNGGGHDGGRWIGALGLVTANTVRSFLSGQVLAPFLSVNNAADLVVLKEMAEAGKIKPVIDGTFPLSESARALAYVAEGHAQGTVVITL